MSTPSVTPSESSKMRERPVSLTPRGLDLLGTEVPLLAGSVHYFRLQPDAWRPALTALKRMGLYLVDTYVPWGEHELGPNEFDFGHTNPRLDVVRFLRLAQEIGLYAIVRPGPHINAELTRFGLPERVVWDEACQARSPNGRRVILPVPPLAFPVPSYASQKFLAETQTWYEALGAVLAPLCFPSGPIVLLQVDNEGAMYFRDGVFDQDYHPDALLKFREFIRNKYEKLEPLRRAYKNPVLKFEQIAPPKRLSATVASDLVPALDFAEFQEHLIASSLETMSSMLRASGFVDVPLSHNLPPAESATVLDPAKLEPTLDLCGLDYYHRASRKQRRIIAERTSELSVRSLALGRPAFAAELGAGFPAFLPSLTEQDNQFAALAALAYGLRGFNLYMTVERDRWIGSPVSPDGELRSGAEFWSRLSRAIMRTRLLDLERSVAVTLIVPRALRRMLRVLHAFGPVSLAAFQLGGAPFRDSCLEDELGLGSAVALDSMEFLADLINALEARGIAWSIASDDLLEFSVTRSEWTVVISPGALAADFARRLGELRQGGSAISVGPYFPERDAGWIRNDAVPFAYEPEAPVPSWLGIEGVDRTVERIATHLGIEQIPIQPGLQLTLFRDAEGVARVIFLLNPSEQDAKLSLPDFGSKRLCDALSEQTWHATAGHFTLEVAQKTVRMLELAPLS